MNSKRPGRKKVKEPRKARTASLSDRELKAFLKSKNTDSLTLAIRNSIPKEGA